MVCGERARGQGTGPATGPTSLMRLALWPVASTLVVPLHPTLPPHQIVTSSWSLLKCHSHRMTGPVIEAWTGEEKGTSPSTQDEVRGPI